jgi:MinD superfamily P-loop ATPase
VIIAVASGKGRTGKTTVAANLAVASPRPGDPAAGQDAETPGHCPCRALARSGLREVSHAERGDVLDSNRRVQ